MTLTKSSWAVKLIAPADELFQQSAFESACWCWRPLGLQQSAMPSMRSAEMPRDASTQ
eukprot:CAMPEP_0197663288 /NCGR_PEP_ID=MMETSP1338-20131121/56876_1 /TAXON_ID=43686 ORGANISM="Pelagodinium beii, Strain RCC1491" /NCGR_SAMPLE_ID=MMETSP1338 /ASSEMBLY_ACC=CAM_ASM_000754 /LENGTH=57 /DNA_ID=CAMNT_0043241585 /DNA_START=94 /DNA_END=264 /DNA_ORIENTATION=+